MEVEASDELDSLGVGDLRDILEDANYDSSGDRDTLIRRIRSLVI